ncbi:hypothetical protein [Actinomadura parmotrematis]|uniref:Uncharacterized protein n=1 Tax=Actinomadura parmotrematis TaxID=2864039 RepID=A0ABS7FLN8_9ACTN|nr:hypothetical protein [Actinomadura parmotrematis]MBW8481288.1 hypothetical protein [Actinomadura parmotrematis]
MPQPPETPPEAPPTAPGAARPARRRRPVLLIALPAVLGVAALAGGATLAVLDLTRKPTAAEIEKAGATELAARWKRLPAGRIFPMAGGDGSSEGVGTPATPYRRLGIAVPVPCADGLDREIAAVLARYGCRTVLRATYSGGAGTLAGTLGVAVLPGTDQATNAISALGDAGTRHGVRALQVGGTTAQSFDDKARRLFAVDGNRTPYVFFRTAGWTDGRGGIAKDDLDEDFAFSKAALYDLMEKLRESNDPCKVEGVRC